MESTDDIQSFGKHMHIIAVWSVVLQKLKQVFDLLIILLLLHVGLRSVRLNHFFRNMGWLSEDQREG